MKRLITLLLLSFLINMSSSALIQKKFYDFTLGVTTKNEVYKYFKGKGIKVIKEREDQYLVENLNFGGELWSFVSFKFYKGKLMKVYFSANEEDKGRQLLEKIWERLNNRIFEKYAEFKDLKLSDEENKIYDDYTTLLTMSYHYFEGIKYVTISYNDKKLMLEKIKDEENEL